MNKKEGKTYERMNGRCQQKEEVNWSRVCEVTIEFSRALSNYCIVEKI